MNREAPSAQIGLRTDRGAMTLDDRLVIGAPSLRTARGYATRPLRFNELNPPRVGKAFLRRIDNLDNVAMGAGGGQLRNLAAHFAHRNPKVRQQHDFREGRWRK